MFNVLARAVFLFFTVFILIRLMGKRQVGELQPYEFVIALMTANLATVPMSDMSLPLLWGVVPVLALSFMQMLFSYISLKSIRSRKFICGSPMVLIAHGIIQESSLNKLRYNLNDLLEQLRTKNIFDLSEVNYAILETNGEISILKNSFALNYTVADAQLNKEQTEMSITLISDGKLISENMTKVNKQEAWLKDKLMSAGFMTNKEILLAQYTPKKELFLQSKAPNIRYCILKVND